MDSDGDIEIEVPDTKSSLQTMKKGFAKGSQNRQYACKFKKNEGKLSKIAKRKGKKLQVKDLKAKIKKLS